MLGIIKYARYAITLLLCCCSIAKAHSVSPKHFGLERARTGEGVYDVLYKTYCYALEHGAEVSYRGIAKINLEMPAKAKSINLDAYIDNDNKSIVHRVRRFIHSTR